MPSWLRVALYVTAAVFAFIQGVRGSVVADDRNRPRRVAVALHLGWLAITAIAIVAAWDAAEAA